MFDINKINNIVHMLNEDYKKIDFKESLLLLETEIIAYLKEINFEPENLREIPLREFTPNNVLEENLKKVREDSSLGFFEGIEKYRRIMYEFLSIYHIGFLSDFCLKPSGLFEVVIPILISKPSVSATPCSDKINFERQLETLEQEGIILEKGKRNRVILPADNVSSLKRLLRKIDAKHIKIDIREEKDLIIDKVSFLVSTKGLENFKERKDTFTIPISDKLNSDEIENIYRLLKEIAQAAQNAQEQTLKDVCGSLLKSSFSNICDILGIETKIQQEQKKRYKKARETNEKKNNLKAEIAEFVSGESLEKTVKLLNNNLDVFFNSNIDFHISNLSVSPYETIKVSIKPIMSFWINDDILMDEESYKKLFKTHQDASRNDYLLVPIFCEENIEKIKKIIKERIPDAIFEEFKANKKNKDYSSNYFYYISEIELTFSDFSKFL